MNKLLLNYFALLYPYPYPPRPILNVLVKTSPSVTGHENIVLPFVITERTTLTKKTKRKTLIKELAKIHCIHTDYPTIRFPLVRAIGQKASKIADSEMKRGYAYGTYRSAYLVPIMINRPTRKTTCKVTKWRDYPVVM